MATAGAHLTSNDHFLCSICLGVFSDPVTTPCGHNFCNNCLSEHWNTNSQLNCPMCKEVFDKRPPMKINTLLSELVAEFSCEAQQETSSSSSEKHGRKTPREVLCDVCTGTEVKSVKSCLECLASYCDTHLEPHLTAPRLRRHRLVDPVENLDDRICSKHGKPLELFCKWEQTCICTACSVLDHKAHKFVLLEEAFEEKKVELKTNNTRLQEMIQERREKIEEIKCSVKRSLAVTDKDKAEVIQLCAALKGSVDEALNQIIEEMEDGKTATEKQAKDLIRELEEEISELMKRSSEVEQLSVSEDHIQFLQNISGLKAPPSLRDWTEVRVHPPSFEATEVKAVTELEKRLGKQMENLKQRMELIRVHQFAVDVTLDPDTAHPDFILPVDGKKVYCGEVETNIPNNPEIFYPSPSVFGKPGFSSGRFYYEAEVKGNRYWVVGVAKESIDRKTQFNPCPQHGCWVIGLWNDYKPYNCPALSLSKTPEKVGVFVDFDQDLVSFYDVETAVRLYSFKNTDLTNKLRPFFHICGSGRNTNPAPLIISPVNQTS